MKLRIVLSALLVLTSALLLSGCLSQPMEPTNYYVLEFDGSVPGAPPERGAADDTGAAAVEGQGPAVIIQDAEVAPMFDRRQLLQRLDGPLVRYRNGDLWAVSPATAVANLVREGVERSPRFGSVSTGRRAAGSYEVVIRIDALTHYCCSRMSEGEVAGELTLLDLRSGSTVVGRRFERREELADEEPRSFVEAVSRILSEEVVAFLAKAPDELE
ncbi:MAG: ABC-type transport auxiliary lipoprotein family protein [Spirochaetia bacterium]